MAGDPEQEIHSKKVSLKLKQSILFFNERERVQAASLGALRRDQKGEAFVTIVTAHTGQYLRAFQIFDDIIPHGLEYLLELRLVVLEECYSEALQVAIKSRERHDADTRGR